MIGDDDDDDDCRINGNMLYNLKAVVSYMKFFSQLLIMVWVY